MGTVSYAPSSEIGMCSGSDALTRRRLLPADGGAKNSRMRREIRAVGGRQGCRRTAIARSGTVNGKARTVTENAVRDNFGSHPVPRSGDRPKEMEMENGARFALKGFDTQKRAAFTTHALLSCLNRGYSTTK